MSACLSGVRCGVDGTANGDYPWIRALMALDNVRALAFCPEDFSLGTPRALPDIHGGDGFDVLDGRARVFTDSGQDVTAEMLRAAQEMLRLAELHQIEVAILMDMSAACGSQVISDGCRLVAERRYRRGPGVCAALLLRAGFVVFSQRDFRALSHLHHHLDPAHAVDAAARDHHEGDWYRGYFHPDPLDEDLALLEGELRVAAAVDPPPDAAPRAIWARTQQIFDDAQAFAARLPVPEALRQVLEAGRCGPLDMDVLAPFAGRWRGTWTQDGATTSWEHHWSRTRREGGMAWQRVRMRGPDGEVPAVNAACLRSGALTGVVGVVRGAAEAAGARPHAGYFICPGELGWLALEGGGDGEPARYSLFHERVEGDGYLVQGWDLWWQRRSGVLQVRGEKKGQYGRVPPIGG